MPKSSIESADAERVEPVQHAARDRAAVSMMLDSVISSVRYVGSRPADAQHPSIASGEVDVDEAHDRQVDGDARSQPRACHARMLRRGASTKFVSEPISPVRSAIEMKSSGGSRSVRAAASARAPRRR